MGFELWAPLQRDYAAGNYEAVADRGRAMLEAENPPYAGLYYNVACCESLAGRLDDAFGHLAHAVALDEGTRAWARQDSDFDALREDPRFAELVG